MRSGRFTTFARNQRGTATLEFVILFPVIMLLFIGAFETSMIMVRQVMLERTLDQAVRALRLSQGATVSADDVRSMICAEVAVLPDCASLLSIDLVQIDRTTYAMPADNDLCVHRGPELVTPETQFDFGADNQIMLLRACMIVDRILPFSGFGLNLVRDSSGGLHMIAAAVFVNEPD